MCQSHISVYDVVSRWSQRADRSHCVVWGSVSVLSGPAALVYLSSARRCNWSRFDGWRRLLAGTSLIPVTMASLTFLSLQGSAVVIPRFPLAASFLTRWQDPHHRVDGVNASNLRERTMREERGGPSRAKRAYSESQTRRCLTKSQLLETKFLFCWSFSSILPSIHHLTYFVSLYTLLQGSYIIFLY